MSCLVFGDVHGDAKALEVLISRAREISGGDLELYSVGDLVDRGPNSKEVIDLCVEQGVQGLMGNHEIWMHKYLNTGEFEGFALHHIMGGKATLSSYGITSFSPSDVENSLRWKIPNSHKEFFLSLALTRTLEVAGCKYRLTHGGVSRSAGEQVLKILEETHPNWAGLSPEDLSSALLYVLEHSSPEVFMWAGAKRGQVFAFPDGSFQVFGHTPWNGGAEISESGRYIALDTGCGTCPPYTLSGVLLTSTGERKILTSR